MRRYFVPILAGGTLADRLVACLGALLGIGLTGLICAIFVGHQPSSLLIIAPMGASAVLIFTVPASPLSQPWPVFGGNVISALVGVTVASFVPVPALAAGLAVGGAIVAMSLTRSLHPPGGAAALTAVVGGPATLSAGYAFPFTTVALNAIVLVALGIAYHRFSGQSYPHRAVPMAGHDVPPAIEPRHLEDIDRALAELGQTFDVSREDLKLLFERVEHHAAQRRSGHSG